MDKRIREGIEACRPASEDLHAPELADVAREMRDDPRARMIYDRVQEFDTAILKSIDDVSVPDGLSQRILECLHGAADESANGHPQELLAEAVAAASQASEPSSEPVVLPSRGRVALTRRNLTGAALTVLLACVLLVVVINLLQEPTQEGIVDLASRWQLDLKANWQKLETAPPDFEVPDAVLAAPIGWQWIDRLQSVPVVAYELAHPKAGKAMLYVARMTRDGLPTAPPLAPQSTSGKAVAYWQSGSRLYVLVVDDKDNYPAFVRSSTTPFA